MKKELLTPQSMGRKKHDEFVGMHGDAVEIVDQESGISEDTYRKVMALMGKKGGLARAKKLSKAKRTAIATLGGLARQKKGKKT